MEDFQKSVVRDNLPYLIENTECSSIFLGFLSSVLCDDDKQNIKSGKTKNKRAARLYDILPTRCDGFGHLLHALVMTKQTKAARILLDAAIIKAVSESKVKTVETTTQISTLFTDIQQWDLAHEVSLTVSIDRLYEVYKRFVQNLQIIELKNTIPPLPSYYISRQLYARRMKLDTDVFSVACSDVFVFKTAQPLQLGKLLYNQNMYISTNQLQNVTGRFILLKEDMDWPDIRTKSRSPTHLVKHKCVNGIHDCLLMDTSGGSQVIHKYLRHNFGDTTTIDEGIFINTALPASSSGICICDKPGMGKSLLLANLARNVQRLHPDRMVAFIQLAKLSEKLSTVISTTDAPACLSLILEYICDNVICQVVIKSLIALKILPIELFLDGFDEMQQHNIETAKLFLSKLRTLPNMKIYVTSRISTRAELEESLGVMSYDIQPFSDENQLDFLTNFWNIKYPGHNKQKIIMYSKFCLNELRSRMKGSEREMAGVPLLCLLVAEVYGEYARIYSQIGRNISTEMCAPDHTSLSQIYAEYIDRQLGCTTCNFECFINGISLGCGLKCKRKSIHAWIAVQNLFPALFKKLKKLFVPVRIPDSGIFSPGLLLKCRETSLELDAFEFVHRTFAEFLLAELFYVILVKEANNAMFNQIQAIFNDFLCSTLLVSSKQCKDFTTIGVNLTHLFPETRDGLLSLDKPFLNDVFVYFFEWFLRNFEPTFGCSHSAVTFPSVHDTLTVILSSIRMNYMGLFLLVSNRIVSAGIRRTRRYRSFFCSDNYHNALLYSLMAAKNCKMAFVLHLVEFFYRFLKLEFSSLIAALPIGCATHLDVSIKAVTIELIQYFAKYFPPQGTDLLRCCLKGNQKQGIWLDDSRLNACKYLVETASDRNTEKCFGHLEIIKGLIALGADITRLCGSNPMYYYVCSLLSKEDFLELQQYVFLTKQIDITINRYLLLIDTVVDHPKEKLSKAKLEELVSLNSKPVSVECFLKDLFYMVDLWRSAENVKELVEWVSLHWGSTSFEKHQTALHLAANCGRVNTVKYLISLGISLDAQDDDGNTPLHLATQRKALAVMERLITNGCNMRIRNRQHKTFFQQAAIWCKYFEEKMFLELVLILKDFVGETRFWEEGGIFREGFEARYGASGALPRCLKASTNYF